jgi:heme exporter protein CcmD
MSDPHFSYVAAAYAVAFIVLGALAVHSFLALRAVRKKP